MQFPQPPRICSKRHGFFYIFIRRCRTALRQANIHQQTITKTCIVPLACQRNDRYAHIERVTGRTAARIRIGIQCNINLFIDIQIRDTERPQNKPLLCYPRRPDTPERKLFAIRIVEDFRLQIQLAALCPPQDFCPKPQHLIGNLREVIETAKSYMTCPQKRSRRHPSRTVMPHIAKVASGQPQEFLRKKGIISLRIRIRICKKIIHIRQSGRRKVTNAGNLNRRRPVSKRQQEIISSMSGQIHKDIDFIPPDQSCSRRSFQTPYIPPYINHRAEFTARTVFYAVCIAIYLKALRVIIFQEGIAEKRHHMKMQVRGNITDPQLFMPSFPLMLIAWNDTDHIAIGFRCQKHKLRTFFQIMQIKKIIAVFSSPAIFQTLIACRFQIICCRLLCLPGFPVQRRQDTIGRTTVPVWHCFILQSLQKALLRFSPVPIQMLSSAAQEPSNTLQSK